MSGNGRGDGRDDDKDVVELFEKFLSSNAKDCED